MGRHHVGDLGPAFLQLLHIHAAFVHVDRRHAEAHTLKNPVRLLVGGIFHGHQVIGAQKPGQQHEQVVVSRADDDLLRAAFDAPGLVKIFAQRFPEAFVSPGIPQLKHLFFVIDQRVPRDLSPRIEWKMGKINAVGGKIIPIALGFLLRFLHRLRLAGGIAPVQGVDLTYKIAPVRRGLYVAFRQKLLIGQIHRTAANL